MNRESKRMMDRQGRTTDGAELETDAFEIGDIAATPRQVRAPKHRTTPFEFFREIREELRQVAWPNRTEMVNYTLVVFFTLVIMIALIFLLNFAFGKGVFFMFQK